MHESAASVKRKILLGKVFLRVLEAGDHTTIELDGSLEDHSLENKGEDDEHHS